MTRFTVVWKRDAEDDLAQIWLGASDRSAVSTATSAIDRALADDPEIKGAPIAEGLRRLVVPPLIAVFWISADDRRVHIDAIRVLLQGNDT
jgi:plasmid stabilization system protein ParE